MTIRRTDRGETTALSERAASQIVWAQPANSPKFLYKLPDVSYETSMKQKVENLSKLTLTSALENNRVISAAGGCRPQR